MDDALYRLHAEREETYWWWVGKNRIILSLIEQYAGTPGSGFRVSGLGSEPKGSFDHTRNPKPETRDPPPRPRALDIGCGAGGVLARLAGRFDATGIDMSPIARDYCGKRGLTALDGMLPDGLPFKEPGTFDVIVLSEVIEHVPEDRASVQRVARLLKPGGILICTVPAHMWLWSSHDDFNYHQRRYTRRQFGALFENLTDDAGVELKLEPLVLSYYQAASMPLVAGARVVEKVKTRLTGKPPSEPEVKPLPGPINWVLATAFSVERFVLPRMRLPWGTSVISVHRRV